VGRCAIVHIDQAVANTAALPNMGRFLKIYCPTGVAPGGELHDLSHADVGLARGAIGRHRDFFPFAGRCTIPLSPVNRPPHGPLR
jgi:hypothetical protein